MDSTEIVGRSELENQWELFIDNDNDIEQHMQQFKYCEHRSDEGVVDSNEDGYKELWLDA